MERNQKYSLMRRHDMDVLADGDGFTFLGVGLGGKEIMLGVKLVKKK
jgi:hypothetical protein